MIVRLMKNTDSLRTNGLETFLYVTAFVLFTDLFLIWSKSINILEYIINVKLQDVFIIILFFAFFYLLKLIRLFLNLLIILLLPSNTNNNHGNYSLSGLKEKAVKENNNTMFLHYKDLMNKNTRNKNIKHLMFFNVVLLVINTFTTHSIITVILNNQFLKVALSTVSLFLLIWSFIDNDDEYTGIRKNADAEKHRE